MTDACQPPSLQDSLYLQCVTEWDTLRQLADSVASQGAAGLTGTSQFEPVWKRLLAASGFCAIVVVDLGVLGPGTKYHRNRWGDGAIWRTFRLVCASNVHH